MRHIQFEPPRIQLSDLLVCYGRIEALQGVAGSFSSGSMTALIGPNGGGKSTLIKTMIGLLKPQKGKIEPNASRLRDITAYLPQQAEVDREFPLRVDDFVAMGLWLEKGSMRSFSFAQRDEVYQALEKVGLKDYGSRSLNALSGGQFQRVMFARLMVQNAQIIFLDEPFTGVDQETVRDMMKFIVDWHQQGKTIIAVLHDLDLVQKYFSDTLLINKKVLDWGCTKTVLEHKALWKVPLCSHENASVAPAEEDNNG